VAVDWNTTVGNGQSLTPEQIRASGALELARAVTDAAGVWYNLTKDVSCYDFGDSATATDDLGRGHRAGVAPPTSSLHSGASALHGGHWDAKMRTTASAATSPESPPPVPGGARCAACPPCDECPTCPVQYCDVSESAADCSYDGALTKTFSWEGITCNEALSQIAVHGVGRDLYWPPAVPERNFTVASVVGPRGLQPGWCADYYGSLGLRGSPVVMDRWSTWMEAYYGGRDLSTHTNIVWSNGALDPWSGQGVYPPGGGSGGPMVQNISADGSQIALVLDLGAHHLDLMFSDARSPPCFREARAIETRMIVQWCQQAYDAHAPAHGR